MKKKQDARPLPAIQRIDADINQGLSQAQVDARAARGAANVQTDGLTPSIGQIILKNTLTLFNLINIGLAVAIIAVGSPRNALFLGVALCNTFMGIFQEIRSKRTLDKLSVLAQAKVKVVRQGQALVIPQDEIVLDDIVQLSAGDQVCADSVVRQATGLEADESLLTGETDRVVKGPGDTVLSGSYITAGRAVVQVTAVGRDNYANALTAQAKKKKKSRSKLLNTLNSIIKVLTIVIIPLGGLLFYSAYNGPETLKTAVLGASSAMLGMIPEGLVLLTGITLTVGAMTLAKKKALVQSLPSIETLARADVLCLDKTGTITDGTLTFHGLEVMPGISRQKTELGISELMGALGDTNSTATALRATFGQSSRWTAERTAPFSSDRKWSGAAFRGVGTFVIGAPGVIFQGQSRVVQAADSFAAQGMRVVAVGFSPRPMAENRLPDGLECQALVLLTDTIRKDAAETFRYFEKEGVKLKVISGDNPITVSAIAQRVGIKDAEKYIDMRKKQDLDDYTAVAENYTVFGHVTPQQKRELIRSLQANGHTACMTGDGVNDILAMREADCSVAMAHGSDAARSACDFVLMSESFSSMVSVMREGRRVINNIDQVSSLYLTKTIYSVLLALLYIFIPFPYPFEPLQLTPVNIFTIGVPSFFLALRANYTRPEGRMLTNIFEYAFPAALTIVFNTVYLQLASHLFDIPMSQSSTMIVFLMGTVGFYLLMRLSRPRTRGINLLIGALGAAFILCFLAVGDFFSLEGLLSRNFFFYLPIMYFSYHVHDFLSKVCSRLRAKWQGR